jgi:hypothetical protein
VQIDENITEEYRMMEPVVPDPVAAHQNNAKPASAVPKKKPAPKPIDNGQTEILINRLTGYLDAQLQKMLATIPALCAQVKRLIVVSFSFVIENAIVHELIYFCVAENIGDV